MPVYFGANLYCEVDLFHSESEVEAAAATSLKAHTALLDDKAYIDCPKGDVAKMLYGRADKGLVDTLKLFKKIVDPKGNLNPGQLLEGV